MTPYRARFATPSRSKGIDYQQYYEYSGRRRLPSPTRVISFDCLEQVGLGYVHGESRAADPISGSAVLRHRSPIWGTLNGAEGCVGRQTAAQSREGPQGLLVLRH